MIGIVSLGVLILTLIMTVYDSHLASQARQDAKRLEQVNAALTHGKNLLALATRAAGISSWEMDIATQTTLWTENEIESLRIAGVDTRTIPTHLGTDPSRRPFHPLRRRAQGRRGRPRRLRFSFSRRAPDGAIVHLEAHARIFCDERGEPLRILGVSWDITEQVLQEERRRELQTQLRDASREAGMAEVATGVLHNVGNVLNSLGVSASLVQSKLRNSRVGNLKRMADLLISQGDQAGRFLEHDERGREMPGYLAQLGDNLVGEHEQPARGGGGDLRPRRTHSQHRGRAADVRTPRRRDRGSGHS